MKAWCLAGGGLEDLTMLSPREGKMVSDKGYRMCQRLVARIVGEVCLAEADEEVE